MFLLIVILVFSLREQDNSDPPISYPLPKQSYLKFFLLILLLIIQQVNWLETVFTGVKKARFLEIAHTPVNK